MASIKWAHSGLFICMFVTAARVACGGLDLSIEGLVDGSISESTKRTDVGWSDNIEIKSGQILRVRSILRNNGLIESVPIIPSLRPEAGVHQYVLVDISGNEFMLGQGRWERYYSAKSRVLLPGEELVFETWFFGEIEETQKADKIESRMFYVFDKPGTYHIFSRYTIVTSAQNIAKASEALPRHIESNKLSVRVVGSIPGWVEIKTAGILDAVSRSFYGCLDSHLLHSLEPLIRTSGDESMIQWINDAARQIRESNPRGQEAGD